MKNSKSVYNADKENSIFAVKLRGLFEETKRTQQELIDFIQAKTGKAPTRQAVSAWTHGNSPDIKTVPIIADFFKVSTDYLLTNTDIRPIDVDLTAIHDYTGLTGEAIEILHIIKACANGEDIFPKEKENINFYRQAVESYQTKLDDLLKNFKTSNLIEQYRQFECDGEFEQADALDDRWCDNEEYKSARFCIDTLNVLNYGISQIKAKSVEKSKSALDAISTLISSQGSEDFLTNLSLFMFTDFKEPDNKQITIKTSSKGYPDDYSLFDFNNKLLDEALLSAILNYIRGLKASNLKSTFYSIDTISSSTKEGDENNG